jgi:IMP dehydrogenase
VLGIVTNRDMRFASDDATPVKVMMTSTIWPFCANLPTGRSAQPDAGAADREAAGHRCPRPLTGLLTLRDIERAVLNPTACKDDLGRLRVAAASTVGDAGFERSWR